MQLFYKPLNQLIQKTGGRWLAGSFFCALLSAGCIILQAWSLSQLVGMVFPVSLAYADPSLYLMIFMIASVLRAVFFFTEQRLLIELSFTLRGQIRRLLADYVVTAGPARIRSEDPGAWAVAFLDKTDALDHYIRHYLPQWYHAAIVPVAIGIAVVLTDWFSVIVLFLTAPLIPLFMILIGHQTERMMQRRWERLAFLGNYFLDRLQGLNTLRFLNQAMAQSQKVEEASVRFARKTLEVLKVAFLSALALEWLASLSIAIVAVETGVRLMNGMMEYMPALFVLLLAPEFYQPLRQLGARFHTGMEGVTAMKAIEQKSFSFPRSQPVESTNPVSVVPPLDVEFNNVVFRYAPDAPPALNGLSGHLYSGKLNAVIGPNGSGKSTMAFLLMRWLQPEQGEIRINGKKLFDLNLSEWQKQIAWIAQHPKMLRGSIRDNIQFGKPGATDEEIRAAVQKAGLSQWIDSLPLGLDTPVAENGSNLSQGQIQRIAAARAFIRNAALWILDEPASYLDPDHERWLADSIREIQLHQTVVVIAHRFRTIRDAGHVLFIQNGVCTGEGTHAELWDRNPEYRRWLSAAGRYAGEKN